MKSIYILANAFTSLTGGDKHFIEVAKRWKKTEGLDITLVVPKSADEVSKKEGLQTKNIIIPPKDISRFGLIITYILRTIFCLCKIPKFKKDIVLYSTSDCLTDVLPALVTKLLNKRAIWVSCSFHLVPHYKKREGNRVTNIISYLSQRISIIMIKFADLLVVDNNIIKNELESMGISKGKIYVGSMGVDKDYIESIEAGNRLYDGCFVGRLHPSKGIYDLIDIWNIVVKNNADAKLAVVGKGDEETVAKLNRKIESDGIKGNIDLLGFLDTKDMFKVIKSSKLFVFPSHEEGWGIAIAEAMACGLPVVIYDLPALREVFPKGAKRVSLGDIANFAKEVVLLLSDNKEYEQLKMEAENLVSKYNWDNVAKKELEKICEICSEI